jgi:hypothetical protein
VWKKHEASVPPFAFIEMVRRSFLVRRPTGLVTHWRRAVTKDQSKLFPETLVAEFDQLHQHRVKLQLMWQQTLALFGTSKERVELLNRSAPAFFSMIQGVLYDQVLLGIGRLLDPPGNSHQSNLVLAHLSKQVRAHGDTALADALDDHLSELRTHCATIRSHRHKRLAHLDLQHAMGMQEFSAVTIADVQRAIDGIYGFLKLIDEKHLLRNYSQEVIEGLGDAEALVRRLGETDAQREEKRRSRGVS